jgi:hypothetical protein
MSIWLPSSINPGSVLARAYGASHLRKKSETKWGGVASIFMFPRALISTRRALHDGWSCLRPSVTPSFQGAAAHRSRSTRIDRGARARRRRPPRPAHVRTARRGLICACFGDRSETAGHCSQLDQDEPHCPVGPSCL